MQAPLLPLGHTIAARFLERGFAYFEEGRVLFAGPLLDQPGGFLGRVEGSRGASKPCVVELWFKRSGSDLALARSECTCPVGLDCKHVAAVVYALLMAEDDEEGAHEGEAAGTDLSAQKAADRPMTAEDWLGALQAGDREASTDSSDDLEGKLTSEYLYRLSRPQRAPAGVPLPSVQLQIGMVNRRYKRDGSLRLRRMGPGGYDWEALHRSPADGAITHLLNAAFPPPKLWDPASSRIHGEQRSVSDRYMAPLVRALVESGRCLWEEDGLPLRPGEERPAAIAWQADEQGRLRLHLAVGDALVVLGSSSPLYVDPAARQVGPLKTAAPEPVLRLLEHAPWLTDAEAAAMYARLPEALRKVLPAPKAPPRHHVELPMRPRLALRWPGGAAGPSPQGATAIEGTLSFLYGEHEVSPDAAEDPVLVPSVDGSITSFARHRDAERQALQAAEALGLARREGAFWLVGSASGRQSLYDMLQRRVRPLEAAGWQVVPLPHFDQAIVRADAPLQVAAADDEAEGHWFQAQLSLDVEGKRVDLVAFIGFAMASGQWGIDEENVDALPDPVYLPGPDGKVVALAKPRFIAVLDVVKQLLSNQGRLGLPGALALNELLDTGDAALRGSSSALQVAERLRHFERLPAVKPSRALRSELRPDQLTGLSWLQFLRSHALAGILADDMGLGKTLQVIAHVLRCKQARSLNKPVLVAAPPGLLPTWEAELDKFAPTLTHARYHGVGRDLSALEQANVILTSYGTLARDEDLLSQWSFDTVVLDESQLIKNPRSAAHRAARSIQADHHLCLSGTPIQNNLEELWAQLAFCMPGLLGDHKTFSKTFARPIKTRQSASAQQLLNQRTKPFLLRRTKREVATELPAKTESVERVALGRQQADLYEGVRSVMDKKVINQIRARGMAQSTINILAALLRLRQVCCDPRLLHLDKLPRGIGSAKLERLLQLLPELIAEGRRVLLFSQFTSMLDLIAAALDKAKLPYLLLTGKTRDRAQVTAAFQGGEAPILLVSLKAGGVGLTLTAADTVIHYDPWWNPSAEHQATDRAHRIGQTQPVHVYKLIVAGSLEEKILQMQADKQQLVDQVMNEGTMASQPEEQDIRQIFAPLPAAER